MADHPEIREVEGLVARNLDQGEEDLHYNHLGHHKKVADDQEDMERLRGGMEDPRAGKGHLRADTAGRIDNFPAGLAGTENHNPAQVPGSFLEVIHRDNHRAKGWGSDIRLEKRLDGRSWSCLGEGDSDIRSWGSREVDLVSLFEGMATCNYRQGSHHCLPWLRDHDCGSLSRWIQKSCHGHREHHDRDHAGLLNLGQSQILGGCGRL